MIQYLTKDKRYLSPKPQNPSRQALQRKGKEAGEFLEEILFGAFAGALELEQMLYILDIKNWEKNLDDLIKFSYTNIKHKIAGKIEGKNITKKEGKSPNI